MAVAMWAYFWIFYSIDLPVCFWANIILCLYFDTSGIALFDQDCFGFLGSFVNNNILGSRGRLLQSVE
jgi:hypothetical protein